MKLKKRIVEDTTINTYIGIDPGLGGGLAVCYSDQKMGMSAQIMPPTERDIWDWFHNFAFYGLPVAVIEKVHSMPGNGVVSMFKFGQNYGTLRMALIASGISFEEITPQTWQKALGIPKKKKTESKSQFKGRLKQRAQQMFPKLTITLKTADAILIALYCKRKAEGLLK